MRYLGWFGKHGATAAHPLAMNVARKLLGYLQIRRQTPGVSTLTARKTLADGTIVEASFFGDQPHVLVTPPLGDLVACELYVESGLLDLGPNIASDATHRFDRGIPQFSDARAVLHFGEGVDCPPDEPGLNGRVQVSRRGAIRSGCLPDGDNPTQSRLSDPLKKQAQAVFPASSWSGLMHRYVAAVYGGNQINYQLSPDGLAIVVRIGDSAVTLQAFGSQSWGLVQHGGALAFVRVTSTTVEFRRLKFTECTRAVFELWLQLRNGDDWSEEALNKLLSVALSGCMPGEVIRTQTRTALAQILAGGNSAWGYAFAENRAMAVLSKRTSGVSDSWRTETCVEELTFTFDGDEWSASNSNITGFRLVPNLAVELKPLGPVQFNSTWYFIASGRNAVAASEMYGDGLDAPIYCYYVGEQRKIFWVSAEAQSEGDIPPWDTLSCYGPPPGSHVEGDSSQQNLGCTILTALPPGPDYYSATTVSFGVYSQIDGVTDWSEVRLAGMFREHNTSGVFLRRNVFGLLRLVGRNPVLSEEIRESSRPDDPGEEPGTFIPFPGFTDHVITTTPGEFNFGEGVRVECDSMFHNAIPGEFLPTGEIPPFAYVYIDITSYRAVYPTIALHGGMGWHSCPLLNCIRGNRNAVAVLNAKADGVYGNLLRSESYAAHHFTHTKTWAWVEDDELFEETVDVGVFVGGQVAGGTYFSRALVEVGPSVLSTNSPYFFTRSKHTGFRTYAEGGLPWIRTDSTRLGNFDDHLVTASFKSSVHIGAEIAYTQDVDGGFIHDQDEAFLGPFPDLGEYSCKPVMGDLLTPPASNTPFEIEVQAGSGAAHLVPFSERFQMMRQESAVEGFGGAPWYVNSSHFISTAGLRGSRTVPHVNLHGGASIGMDRESVNHGYPLVNTPSFVGWA